MMATDNEINEAVARKLGLKPCEHPENTDNSIWTSPQGKCTYLKDYCHSIEAAWEIVEKFKKDGFKLEFESYPWDDPKRWHAGISIEEHDGSMTTYNCFKAEADTAPMAICLAFLKMI